MVQPAPPLHQSVARRENPTSERRPTAATGLSVIVPLYNESPCVAALIASLEQLERLAVDGGNLEFLLIDDGSTDDTVARLEAAVGDRRQFAVLRHEQNRGIAAAIDTGLHAASHDVAASIDCDGSYDLAELPAMTRLLVPGVDLVTASPYHPAGGVENVPAWRLYISRAATRMYGVAMGRRFSCYTSCFRVYRRSSVATLPVTQAGFVGVAELMCRLLAAGGTVVEHPVVLRSRVAGHSKMRVLRASGGHLRLMARFLIARLVRRAPEP